MIGPYKNSLEIFSLQCKGAMDWVRNNPGVTLGLVAAVGFGLYWWYRSRQEMFWNKKLRKQIKDRAKKIGMGIGKVAGRVGDIGLQVVDDRLGTNISGVTKNYGGVYGAFAGALRA